MQQRLYCKTFIWDFLQCLFYKQLGIYWNFRRKSKFALNKKIFLHWEYFSSFPCDLYGRRGPSLSAFSMPAPRWPKYPRSYHNFPLQGFQDKRNLESHNRYFYVLCCRWPIRNRRFYTHPESHDCYIWEHYVLWFDITMKNVVSVQIIDCIAYLV